MPLFGEKKIGILDPQGLEKNPFTKKRTYTEVYFRKAKIWSNLPVYQSGAERLIKHIRDNRVMVLESGPGSGKTVLVPKFALHSIDYKGKVIVTVPKRSIALSNAIRDAEWTDSTLGEEVGYRYRGSKLEEYYSEIKGDDKSYSEKTKLLFATDGTLVSILQKDQKLEEFSIVIIDEAHERSTGIDEALLFMREALRMNKKLKLIIMSATLPNSDLFLDYFAEFKPHHEELPGKENKFKVGITWSREDFTQKQDAEKEIVRILFDDIINKGKEGDVLIFVSSGGMGNNIEQEINSRDDSIFTWVATRKTNEEDLKLIADADDYLDYEPGRPNGGWSRKVIVATNVAESSLTIDGLVYVIDNGMEIKSDFDADKQLDILRTQLITKAQAIQRKGRVGRTAPGHCWRLFTKDTYDNMEPSPTVAILSEDMTSNFLKYLLSPRIRDLLGLVRFTEKLIEVPCKENVINSIRNLMALSLVDEFEFDGKLTDEGKMVGVIMGDGKLDNIYIANALMTSRYFRCEGILIVMAAILPSIKSGLGDLFLVPKKGAGKKKLKEFEETLTFFSHPYGDLFTFYKTFMKYSDADNRMNKNELNRWCKNHFLKEGILRSIKESAKNIKRGVSRRLNKIEQIDEEYYFKNCEEAALFSLLKGFYPNLCKRVPGGKKYINFYPRKQTTASFDRFGDSTFSRLSDGKLPTYMFYIKNFKIDKSNTFLICNKITLDMIKLLKPYELFMLEGLKV